MIDIFLAKKKKEKKTLTCSALGVAAAGAMGKSMGSVAASANPLTMASGLMLCFSAACRVMSTSAAAPSLRVLALAAVTVPPSGWKTVRSLLTLNQKKKITEKHVHGPPYKERIQISADILYQSRRA